MKEFKNIYNGTPKFTPINKLHNPKNIEGILLWNRGTPLEIGKQENQAFQEYPKRVELWQLFDDGRLMMVQRWLKRGITHFVINNKFVPKD